MTKEIKSVLLSDGRNIEIEFDMIGIGDNTTSIIELGHLLGVSETRKDRFMEALNGSEPFCFRFMTTMDGLECSIFMLFRYVRYCFFGNCRYDRLRGLIST